MGEPKSMNIIETCRVAPNSSPSQFSLPLTFLDKFWLLIDPTSRLIFYEFPQEKHDSLDIYVNRLKKSLSFTLNHYLPLAGRLTWPQDSEYPVVQYQTGDTISLTVAKTQADFHSISGNEFRSSDVLRSLLPDFPISRTQAPAMTLQITMFSNIGFCISYVAHHAVMDGKSISMFLHSWAYICRHEDNVILPPELTPSFDRSFVKQHEELQRTFPQTIGNTDPERGALKIYDMNPTPDTMLGTFVLTRANIDTLKKSVLAYLEKKNRLETTTRISTFIVSTAYVIACLTKAKEITAQKVFIGINVNARARLDPPLPPNYFGNCVVWCGGWQDGNDFLSEKGVAVAAEMIMKALGMLNEGMEVMGKKINDLISSITKDFVGFGIAGSPQFELYKMDFGWGKPKKVEMISIDRGSAFYLSDDRNGSGGIEIGVALKKHETEAFTSIFASGLHACHPPQSPISFC